MAIFYPNIPDVPGVPPILRNPLVAQGEAVVSLLTQDSPEAASTLLETKWGIFQNGEAQIDADSVISIENRQEWRIATFPIEPQGFQSYDKVDTPFDAKVSLSTGGSQEDREAFLNSIAAISGNTELYDIVTPEVTYQNVNVLGYNYRRTSTNGVGRITVEIALKEIRFTAAPAFSNTAEPDGSDAVSGGTVQAVPSDASIHNPDIQ